ncbi:MAG TPA: GNAT family N-acetyltransferase [Clostridia bacterium]|nr:GNAT family N-acetyltransferase [Clostridia bacterium]
MSIIQASGDHFDIVRTIVRGTIEAVYPDYYPSGAVDFFLRHHSDEAIQMAIRTGCVYLLQVDGEYVGTGSIDGNELNRVFVLPQYQGRGYGTTLLDELERMIFGRFPEIVLDASLPAFGMYLHRGYVSLEYHKHRTENGNYLCYHVMKKTKKAGE